jgi:polyhydroxybutyrate depolymerase
VGRRGLLVVAALLVLLVSGLIAVYEDEASGSVMSGPVIPLVKARPAGPAGTGGLARMSVTVDGRVRTYLMYVPPGDTAKHRLPLVLDFPGAGDTATAQPAETGLLTIADHRRNMIVVFMQGYEDTWNDDAGDPPAEAAHINDIGFTTTVLHRIESSYFVDMRRVVATGLSNGAIFDELLGCRIASSLTLIAPVEGQIAPTFSHGCEPAMPISVYEVHATGDPAIPYKGGTFQGDGGPVSVLSAPASVARWAALDHCAAHAGHVSAADGALTDYRGCRNGVTVTLDTTNADVHDWPTNFGQTLVGQITALTGKRKATKP